MTTETEVKVKVGSKESLTAELRESGFSKVKEYHERNLVIDRGGEMRKSDRLLRFRRIIDDGTEEVFTYKGPRMGDMKTREEIEFPVNISKLSKVFDRLGYSTAFKYEKKRQVWQRGQLEVVLDQLPYIGRYMEIEGTPNRIEGFLSEMGIPMEETITETYLELFESYREENDIDAEFMVWENFELEEPPNDQGRGKLP